MTYNLLIGGTLYIGQGGEVVSDSAKACQNLKNKERENNMRKEKNKPKRTLSLLWGCARLSILQRWLEGAKAVGLKLASQSPTAPEETRRRSFFCLDPCFIPFYWRLSQNHTKRFCNAGIRVTQWRGEFTLCFIIWLIWKDCVVLWGHITFYTELSLFLPFFFGTADCLCHVVCIWAGWMRSGVPTVSQRVEFAVFIEFLCCVCM